MTQIGIVITLTTVLVLVIESIRNKRRKLPAYGWIGMALLLVAEALLYRRVWPVTVYFTPIAWTAYLLIADAAVFAIQGHSRLRDERLRFFLMALLSIPLWLIFEAYNLRLVNWTYVGVPNNVAAALLGYGWSFATITPGILETADLVEAFGWFKRERPICFSPTAENFMIAIGGLCLLLPLVASVHVASYMFGLVWIGFVFLLDPVNHRLGLPSLLGDLAEGRRSRLYALFISGWVCGWLWEFWNFWAAAKWHYIFPIMQRTKIFEMPVAGYLGFLPFALECFVMYVAAMLVLEHLRRPRSSVRTIGHS